MTHNRSLGCLLGAAVGDALGGRYEFSTQAEATRRVRADRDARGHLPILGKGPHSLVPGQITDDTELALAMARSIARCGRYDREDVARSYRAWYVSRPFDIGRTTRNALRSGNSYAALVANAVRENHNSLSNGCLMRLAPLGVHAVRVGEEAAAQLAALDCSMTHCNPMAIDACRAYVELLRRLILGATPQQAVAAAIAKAQTQRVRQTLRDCAGGRLQCYSLDAKGYRVAQPIVPDGAHQGYLGIALGLAAYELVHARSFSEAMLRTVSAGGDTDTNACIVGAVVGARFGAAGIPADWRKAVSAVRTARQQRYPWASMHDHETLVRALSA